MSTVVNNAEVARLWARKLQDHASGSHFFFRGKTIYSYGGHFPIARHATWRGKPCVFFTKRRYSNSTAVHCGLARHFIPKGVPVFDCVDPFKFRIKPQDIVLCLKWELECEIRRARRALLHGEWIVQSLPRMIHWSNWKLRWLGRKERLRLSVDDYKRLLNYCQQRTKDHIANCISRNVLRRLQEAA